MPLPDKKSANECKTILQTDFNSFEQDNDTTTVIVNGSSEGDTGVTYYVDEEGRYYYQLSGDIQSLVSLPTEAVAEESPEIPQEAQMLVDGEDYQTVTLVPSEGGGELIYVLVMQEEAIPMINIDNKIDQDDDEESCVVYTFADEEKEEAPKEISDVKKSIKPRPRAVKRNRNVGSLGHFKCDFCSYTSPKRYLLVRHMKTHSDERPHKCSVCDRGFKTTASLQNHLNMHNGVKPHVCKYCKRAFTTSGELVRHIRYRHTYEKPHKCTECEYASVERSKLQRHVRCHTGERPYQCPDCSYASQDAFKLKRHMLTHTGEKPFKCDRCTVGFSQSNSLKAHKLVHNVSERPVFPCELCPRKCGRKTDLRIHIQNFHTSDKPLKCERCGESFPDRYSCKMHNKTHKGEKCFKCELCSYASITLRQLKSHSLKHTDGKHFVSDEKPFISDDDESDQSFRDMAS